MILSWDPAAVPEDWGIARRGYFRLNWIRGALTWLVLTLFVVAALLHYG